MKTCSHPPRRVERVPTAVKGVRCVEFRCGECGERLGAIFVDRVKATLAGRPQPEPCGG
jgi:peptide methionine sulfoxide reductase MsrB